MNKLFASKYTLKVEGLNIEKLITLLLAKGIVLYAIDRVSKNLVFLQTNRNSLRKLFDINKKLCYNITVVKVSGLFGLLHICKSHIAFVITACILISLLIVSRQYVWRIEVLGVDDASQVLQVVEPYARVGMSKSQLDCDKIGQVVKLNIDNIALASVSYQGTTVIINIEQKIKAQELNPSGVYAKANGVITSIRLVSGTLLCKVGDVVSEGQLLVAPYIINGESKVAVNATAEIYATAEYTSTVIHSQSIVRLTRSGESKTINNINICNRTLFANDSKPYERYESNVECIDINCILPIRIVSTTYYELVERKYDEPFESCKDEIVDSVMQSAKRKMIQDSEILSQDVLIKNIDDIYYVTAYIKTNIRID